MEVFIDMNKYHKLKLEVIHFNDCFDTIVCSNDPVEATKTTVSEDDQFRQKSPLEKLLK